MWIVLSRVHVRDHCRHRHLPEGSVFFFRCNNVGHSDMHRTLNRLRLALLQPNICVLQGISLRQEHLTSFGISSGATGCHWEELLEKGVWIHLPMTIEILLDPFPTGLATFPLNASFGECREASFGAPSHSGPLLTNVLWSALSMAYIWFDHNMPCSPRHGHTTVQERLDDDGVAWVVTSDRTRRVSPT